MPVAEKKFYISFNTDYNRFALNYFSWRLYLHGSHFLWRHSQGGMIWCTATVIIISPFPEGLTTEKTMNTENQKEHQAILKVKHVL